MGVRVIDRAGQEARETDPQDATAGFLSGKYALEDRRVRIGRGNDTGFVDADALVDAISDGWEVIDEEDASKRRLRREESDAASLARGGIERAAAGATLGLSSLVMEEVFGADPTRMRARSEALGGLGTAIEVGAGVVGGGLGVGRTGAKLGARALLPSSAATALGETVEVAAKRALGEAAETAAGRVVQRAVPVTGRGFVEGFAYGAGAEIDESVLGEREITAERLIASGLLSGLFGGAAEVGLRVAIPGLVSGSAKASSQAVGKVLGNASGAEGGGPNALAKAIADKGSSAWSYITGAPKDEGLRLLGLLGGGAESRAKLQRAMTDMRGVQNEVATTLTDSLTRVRTTVDDAVRLTGGTDNKLRQVERLLPKNSDDVAPRVAAKQVTDAAAKLDEMIAINEARGFKSFVDSDIRKARDLASRALEEMVESPKAAGAFRSLDRFKRSLDGVIHSRGGTRAIRMAPPEVQDTIRALSEINKGIREGLTDTRVWGKAGEMQAELNAAITARMANVRDADSAVARMFRGDAEVDPGHALSIVRRYGRDVKGERFGSDLDSVVDSELAYLETVRKHFELPPDVARKIDDAHAEVKKMRAALRDKAELAGIADDYRSLRAAESADSVSIGMTTTAGPAILGTLGLSLGGLPGAAAGLLAGAVTRPSTTVRALSGIMAMVDRVRGRSDGAVARFLGTATRKGTAKALPGSDTLRRGIRIAGAQAVVESRSEKNLRVRSAVIRLAQSPDALTQEVEPHLMMTRDMAPALTSAIGRKATLATHFLMSKLPPVYTPPFGTEEDALVDPIALDRFGRYVEAVGDPVSALERLADGTITSEHAEALRSVYPEIYRDVQGKIMEEMEAARRDGQDVPHDRRMTAGLMFGLPLTAALQPGALAAIQSAHATAPESEPTPQRVRSTAARDTGFAERSATAASRLERPLEG